MRIRIPIDDGGSIEVDENDPRARAYLSYRRGIPAGSVQPVSQPTPPASRPPRRRASGTGAVAAGIYTVRSGDTLSAVARDLLGAENQWPLIAEINDLEDPDRLRVGQLLALPYVPVAQADPSRANIYTGG